MSTLRTAELTLASRANAYVALTKPDVSFLVLITTAAGFYMGSRGPVDWLHMVHTVFGTMLIAAGTAALNHYIERDSDRLMRRTASRPLPSGVLKPRQALVYGSALAIAGALYLYFAAGTLAAALGVATCLGYLLAYTPLKKRTVWATFVGAFPGAIPCCRWSKPDRPRSCATRGTSRWPSRWKQRRFVAAQLFAISLANGQPGPL